MNYASMIEEKRLKQGFIIATLISTIVGTFTTGINLFDRISEKRRQHKTDHGQDEKIRDLERRVSQAEAHQSPTRARSPRRGDDDLRVSLHGGEAVRREYDRGYAAMGRKFAEGDLIAQTLLQSQIITLQGTVIKLLEEALITGRPPDVTTLSNSCDFAREGSIKALRDQYQRLLQAAPIQRPMGPVRRVSSTPALRASSPSTSVTAGWNDRRPPQKAITFNRPGRLFCPYAEDLQRTNRPLDKTLVNRGYCGPCPACGAVMTSDPEARRSWNIVKEVVRERVSRGAPDGSGLVEIVQDRTYLLTDRFIVKCHREGFGYACFLCFQHRDRDALCKGVESLVKHVLEKHDIKEYETDPDIRDLTSAYFGEA